MMNEEKTNDQREMIGQNERGSYEVKLNLDEWVSIDDLGLWEIEKILVRKIVIYEDQMNRRGRRYTTLAVPTSTELICTDDKFIFPASLLEAGKIEYEMFFKLEIITEIERIVKTIRHCRHKIDSIMYRINRLVTSNIKNCEEQLEKMLNATNNGLYSGQFSDSLITIRECGISYVDKS